MHFTIPPNHTGTEDYVEVYGPTDQMCFDALVAAGTPEDEALEACVTRMEAGGSGGIASAQEGQIVQSGYSQSSPVSVVDTSTSQRPVHTINLTGEGALTKVGPVDEHCMNDAAARAMSDCRVKMEAEQSGPKIARDAPRELADLVSDDGRATISEAFAAGGTIYYYDWKQKYSIPNIWQEQHAGRMYYDGTYVWTITTYRGYKGSHVCGQIGDLQWITQVDQCTSQSGVKPVNLDSDYFTAYGPGTQDKRSMTAWHYASGANDYYYYNP